MRRNKFGGTASCWSLQGWVPSQEELPREAGSSLGSCSHKFELTLNLSQACGPARDDPCFSCFFRCPGAAVLRTPQGREAQLPPQVPVVVEEPASVAQLGLEPAFLPLLLAAGTVGLTIPAHWHR
jgi:hypothetical protein